MEHLHHVWNKQDNSLGKLLVVCHSQHGQFFGASSDPAMWVAGNMGQSDVGAMITKMHGISNKHVVYLKNTPDPL